MQGTSLAERLSFLPVHRNGDSHVDGGGHEGVGSRVEERHEDGISASLVDLKHKI